MLSLALPGSSFTALAAGVGCTIATALLTGGFHERGLASVADGLWGGSDRETAFEHMRNPGFGVHAAMALALGLLAKISLLAILASYSPVAVLAALFAQGLLFVVLGIAVSAFALLWMRWRFMRRLQGLTGERVDATQQVCEIAFYLGCAMAPGPR